MTKKEIAALGQALAFGSGFIAALPNLAIADCSAGPIGCGSTTATVTCDGSFCGITCHGDTYDTFCQP